MLCSAHEMRAKAEPVGGYIRVYNVGVFHDLFIKVYIYIYICACDVMLMLPVGKQEKGLGNVGKRVYVMTIRS